MALLLKNLLFTLLQYCREQGVVVPLMLARDRPPATGPEFFVALGLLATGGATYAWTVWDFASLGRGTPAPIDARIRLVVRGLYRYTRNPMYVGVLTVLLGWVVLYQAPMSLVYAIGVAICFHLFVVLYEEPHLAQVFEAEYSNYCASVGRWLPHFRAHAP
jgi:protein-S-isoprenylcysteine O-methyltransferase Ste14